MPSTGLEQVDRFGLLTSGRFFSGLEAAMATTNVEVELISPMFLRGADNETPELRPPSVKGILRFWWRASKALPVDELRDQETALFGSARGEGGRRSTIDIRLKSRRLRKGTFKPVPRKGKGFTNRGFAPDQRFEIVLRRRPQCPVPLREVRSALLVAIQLGGLGYRSRRGFGAMRITAVDGAEPPSSGSPLQSTYDALGELCDRFAYDESSWTIEYTGSQQPPYPFIQRAEASEWLYPLPKEANDDHPYLLRGIAQATHDHNSDYTGSPNRPRLASPEVVTLQSNGSDCWPVVTSLHLPDSTRNRLRGRDTRADFREAVLNLE